MESDMGRGCGFQGSSISLLYLYKDTKEKLMLEGLGRVARKAKKIGTVLPVWEWGDDGWVTERQR